MNRPAILPPTPEQRAALAADFYRRCAAQREPAHTDALREVMQASERAAHVSRGYRPSDDVPPVSKRARIALALWTAFGIGAWATYLYFALGAQP